MVNRQLRILICFGAHDKWYGRLVRFILGYPFNHVFAVYESQDWGQWMAIEVISKISIMPFEISRRRYSKLRAYECSEDLTPGLLSMVDYLGTSYDWKGVMGGLVRLALWKLFRFDSLTPFHSESKLFCTEYVAELLKRNNLPKTDRWQTWRIGPETLESFLISSSLFKQVNYVLGL